jgi:hypothetical protein
LEWGVATQVNILRENVDIWSKADDSRAKSVAQILEGMQMEMVNIFEVGCIISTEYLFP